MDVLRAHTDQSGYDIVLEVGPLVRHVQLKSSYSGAKTSRQKVNVKLATKLSGCVIWQRFDADTLELTGFLWFGSPNPRLELPPLGDKLAKHTKGNKDGDKNVRKQIRVLNKGQFEPISNIADLAERLFPANAIVPAMLL